MSTTPRLLAVAALTALSGSALGAERDVQFWSVHFDTAVLELHNCGSGDIDLSNWRFCSHDNNQVRQYTAETGLNGMIIEAGTSVFIHFNNDAPADPDHRNVSALGGLIAAPLDASGGYAISLFFPDADGNISFADFSRTDIMGDHIQWSTGGVNDPIADERSQQAVNAGLWTAATDWISTTLDTVSIELTDMSCGILHGPSNYQVNEPAANCNAADLAEPFGTLDFSDVVAFLTAFGTMDPAADLAAPMGVFDFSDVVSFLTAFGSGCP
ncbi:MAG: GC-type dockerin domain-anchored protein [Phycisphaerales bacterium]